MTYVIYALLGILGGVGLFAGLIIFAIVMGRIEEQIGFLYAWLLLLILCGVGLGVFMAWLERS